MERSRARSLFHFFFRVLRSEGAVDVSPSSHRFPSQWSRMGWKGTSEWEGNRGEGATSGYGVGDDRVNVTSRTFESVKTMVSNLGDGVPTGAASKEKRCTQALRDRYGKGEREGQEALG